MKHNHRDDHWLTRDATIRAIWIGFGTLLASLVVAQFFVEGLGDFALSRRFGFAAWFGFLSCVAMVLLARVLGWLIKRPESYYEHEPDQSSGGEHGRD